MTFARWPRSATALHLLALLALYVQTPAAHAFAVRTGQAGDLDGGAVTFGDRLGQASGETVSKCNYGSEPGYWWASRYKLFSKVGVARSAAHLHVPVHAPYMLPCHALGTGT